MDQRDSNNRQGSGYRETIEVFKPWHTSGAPNAEYNCFAFAFGHQDFWIKDPAAAEMVLKSEYKKIVAPGVPAVGNIGIYRDAAGIIHATVVSKVNTGTVLEVDQKDGTNIVQFGLPIGDVVYAGPVEYWE